MDTELLQEFRDGITDFIEGRIPSARNAFLWCANLDPKACDTYRALAVTENDGEGPASYEQVTSMWENRDSYGKLLTAARFPATHLNSSRDTGMWGITTKLCTKNDIILAYATVLTNAARYDEAEQVLGEAAGSLPWTALTYAHLHYVTRRWSDVLSYSESLSTAATHTYKDTVTDPPEPDTWVRALSSLMAGEALCHLEHYRAGLERLNEALSCPNEKVAGRAGYIAGLAYRSLGDEKKSSDMLAFALSKTTSPEILHASSDLTARLDITNQDLIEQRADKWNYLTEPSLIEERAQRAHDSREGLLEAANAELASFIGLESVKMQVRKLQAKTQASLARQRKGMEDVSKNHHMRFVGPPGCIQGDALIAVNRAGKGFTMPLRDVVRKFNNLETNSSWAWDMNIPTYVQREVNGNVRLGKLAGAWHSGVKTTYTVTTDTGRTVRATDEHPFLTERGWLRLDQLVVGDEVHVRGVQSSKGRQSKPRYRTVCVANHPYSGSRNRVAIHRLIAEAHHNGMKYDDFLSTVRTGDTSTLKFLDPEVWAVHHIDRDSSNNDPSNLQVLTHSEHFRLHAEEGNTTNVHTRIATEKVVSVELFGEEDTYDLEVEDDPHNFLANGFVVHNTGKTTIARVVAKIFAGLGIVAEDKFIEASRADFVGNTIGSTAIKTKATIEKAIGGVLFLDEAYALVYDLGPNQSDAFGKEALDVIVAEMENRRDEFVFIIAGYPKDIENLLAVNDGLKSRFSQEIEFPSYSAEELWKIAEVTAKKRGTLLGDGAKNVLVEKISTDMMTREGGKKLIDIAGNGRFIRQVIERAEDNRDLRLLQETIDAGTTMDDLSPEQLATITDADLKDASDTLADQFLGVTRERE